MQCDTMQGATMARKHMVWDMLTAPIREACACISGLVVEYIAAIDVARDRCPADALMWVSPRPTGSSILYRRVDTWPRQHIARAGPRHDVCASF